MLLAMSGMIFGQKEGRVLWENLVDKLPYYQPNSYFDYDNGAMMQVSPAGNTMLCYPDKSVASYGTKMKGIDKDGKFMWSSSELYKNEQGVTYPSVINSNYFTIGITVKGRGEGQLYFDRNYNFIKTLTYPTFVDNGWFENDLNSNFIKYDSLGREEWRYKNQDGNYIQLFSTKPPYVGILKGGDNSISKFIVLQKNGIVSNLSESFDCNNILGSGWYGEHTIDENGGWGINSQWDYNKAEYIKFNKVGKITAKVPARSLMTEESYKKYNTTHTTGSKYLILSYLNLDKNEVFFSRIDSLGNVRTIASNCVLKGSDFFGEVAFGVKVLDEKDIIYNIGIRENNGEVANKYEIGVVRFDTSNLSWRKTISVGASSIFNSIIIRPNNTFFQVSSKDYSPIKSFKLYDVNGNIQWESSFEGDFTNSYQLKIIKDYFYVNLTGNKSTLAKVRFSDGKIIWSKEQYSIYSFQRGIKQNKNGDDVIFYERINGSGKLAQNFSVIDNSGLIKWTYTFPKFIYKEHTDFGFNENKVIVSTLEPDGNLNNHVLRKISPCEDLNAISITANNTEACPTEKVRLSATKQDGITYQWQKDGKDLPNYRDVVYDMSESGIYTLVGKDETCQNTVTSNALKVTIRSLPSAEITAPKTVFCEGGKITLASQTNGSFFQWQKDGKDIPNATSGIYEVSQSGDYRVGVRDDKCPQVGFSNIITINVKPSPEATISTDIKGVVYEPFKVKLNANVGVGLSYEWYKNDSLITNATTSIYEANKSGTYQVKVSKDGCVKLSEPFKISILIPLANESEVGEEEVQVYPNPSRGEFNVILPKSLKNADIQLFDSFGRERSIINIGEQIQANGLTQGVYFLKIGKADKVVTSKIVIE